MQLRYKVPKKILVVVHNGSTHECHFIIKQLAEDFKGQFECLGENTEKYISFLVPIVKDNKDDNSKWYHKDDHSKKNQMQTKVYW